MLSFKRLEIEKERKFFFIFMVSKRYIFKF